MRRLTAYVSGTVQKTGYRAQVVLLANAFGLTGYTQNLPEGVVKVVAEGVEQDLNRFLSALKIRDALIDVQHIEAQYSMATGEFVGFEKMVARGETDQRLDRAAGLIKELIVVNKDVVKELRSTREGLQVEIRATRNELRDEIKTATKELRDEIKTTREELKDEIKATREGLQTEIKATREGVEGVRDEIKVAGKILAEKIDGAKEEIGELRCELRNDLKERLVRMEADVSQIKTRVGM